MFRGLPCVRQTGGEDCGVAVLATLARYYGKTIGLERIWQVTGARRAGTSLWGLEMAARELGFDAEAVKGGRDALDQTPLPAIAHCRKASGEGHFLVLYRLDRRRVVVGDPAVGIRVLDVDEFLGHWTGFLLLVGSENPPTAKAGWRPLRRQLERLRRILRPHRVSLASALLVGLALAGVGIGIAFLIRYLVDGVVESQGGSWLAGVGVALLALALGRTGLTYLRGRLLARMSCGIDRGLLEEHLHKVIALPLRFFEVRQPGSILSRADDAVKIRQAFGVTALTVVLDATTIVASAAVMVSKHLALGAVAVALVALFLATFRRFRHEGAARAEAALETHAQFRADALENWTGIATIKTLAAEGPRTSKVLGRLGAFIDSMLAFDLLQVKLSSLATLFVALAQAGVLWFGGTEVFQGALSVGELMLMYSLLSFMTGPLERLAATNMSFQEAAAALERYSEMLEESPEADAAGTELVPPIAKGIELEGVTFAYGRSAPAVDRVDLTIPSGGSVAIVGESGSGKTTLVKLLLRLYTPDSGRILVDGEDVRRFDLTSWRERIGVVSQEPTIFDGSVRENIAFGRDVREEAVLAAARAAELHELVEKLPGGYDSRIGPRGNHLSAGQRQRLALARALVVDPELLVLDEANSHLDELTAGAIERNLGRWSAGRSVLVVTHRLQSIVRCERIYVMRGGRLVEQGTHDELVASGGYYAHLFLGAEGRERADAPLAAGRGA